jgi:hypothetical protein
MCGLAGFARQVGFGDVKASLVIAETLMCEIGHRGRHATGFAAVNKAGDAEIWKKAVAVEAAVKSDTWKEAMVKLGESEITMFIGHVRYSTHHHNKDKDEAAHPFYENGVVGAHNGVIMNWREVGKKLGIGKDWDVDSQAAIGALAKMKQPTKALKLLEGWFALTWIKKGKLFMVKSVGSPLACAYVPHVRTLFWCSEMKVLRSVIDRAVPEKFPVDFYELQDERLYEYDVKYFGNTSNVQKTDMKFENAGSHRKNQTPTWQSGRGYQQGAGVTSVDDYWAARGWDTKAAAQIPMPLNDDVPKGRTMNFGEMELAIRKLASQAQQMWTFIGNQNAKIARQATQLDAVKEIAGLALELANVQQVALGEYGFTDERVDKVLTRAQHILKATETDEETKILAEDVESDKPEVVEHHGQADGAATTSESRAVTIIRPEPVAEIADRKCGGCGQPASDGDPLFSDGRGGFTHDSCIFAATDAVYAD